MSPYGKYKNPKICDAEALWAASETLKKADIICGDYLLVLEYYAQPGDFVFLETRHTFRSPSILTLRDIQKSNFMKKIILNWPRSS